MIWILNGAVAVVPLAGIVIIMYMKAYIIEVFKKFNYNEGSLYFSLFIPFIALFIIFFYGNIDSLLVEDRSNFPHQMFDIHELASLVRNVEYFLRSATILDIQGDLFAGYSIVILITILTVINLIQVFIRLKSLLFKSTKCGNSDKLHLIIGIIILIVLVYGHYSQLHCLLLQNHFHIL